MTTLTPEQPLAIEQAGDQPVRAEDPETHQAYVILKAEAYEKMRALLEEEIDPSFFEIGGLEPVSPPLNPPAGANPNDSGRIPRG